MSTITDTFHIALQKGIKGGFAPPTPQARHTIARSSNSDVFIITSQVRPHGTPSLLPPTTKELKVADHVEQIARLQHILRDLPPQYPGAQDLYGRDTSIVQLTNPEDFLPSGSFAGSGIPSPTEEQKTHFDEAGAIIEKWVAA